MNLKRTLTQKGKHFIILFMMFCNRQNPKDRKLKSGRRGWEDALATKGIRAGGGGAGSDGTVLDFKGGGSYMTVSTVKTHTLKGANSTICKLYLNKHTVFLLQMSHSSGEPTHRQSPCLVLPCE